MTTPITLSVIELHGAAIITSLSFTGYIPREDERIYCKGKKYKVVRVVWHWDEDQLKPEIVHVIVEEYQV